MTEIAAAKIDYEKIRTFRQRVTDSYKSGEDNPKQVREVTIRIIENFLKEVKIRDFTMIADEPETIGGTNKGPRPTELLLAALGTCLQSIMVIQAAAMRIRIDAAEFKLRGFLDRRGLYGFSDIRPGFEKITVETRIKSPESEDRIKALLKAVEKNCPVTDNLTRPVPITQELYLNGASVN